MGASDSVEGQEEFRLVDVSAQSMAHAIGVPNVSSADAATDAACFGTSKSQFTNDLKEDISNGVVPSNQDDAAQEELIDSTVLNEHEAGDVKESVELCEEAEVLGGATLDQPCESDEAKENCPPDATVTKDTHEADTNPEETTALQVRNVLPTWTLMTTVSNIVEQAYQRGAGDTTSNEPAQHGPVKRKKQVC